ncbi:hypothetical protein, partial [Actinoplanes sp. NBRC 103695]|uniref:hypothetical protein n=1 Tax=Actinoplanes sp. NBRC 103695 TaxID=3032202 RepID=UPI0025527177
SQEEQQQIAYSQEEQQQIAYSQEEQQQIAYSQEEQQQIAYSHYEDYEPDYSTPAPLPDWPGVSGGTYPSSSVSAGPQPLTGTGFDYTGFVPYSQSSVSAAPNPTGGDHDHPYFDDGDPDVANWPGM